MRPTVAIVRSNVVGVHDQFLYERIKVGLNVSETWLLESDLLNRLVRKGAMTDSGF